MSEPAAARPGPGGMAGPLLGLALVLALCAAVYWPGLRGELILDDYPNLEPFIAFGEGRAGWGDVVLGNDSGPLGRPVAMLSFALDWRASGGEIAALKLSNLQIHLLCGVLLFALAVALGRAAFPGAPHRAGWIGLWVCALWLLAPVHVSTVLYVVQRMAQLAAMFSLAGLLAYAAGRQALAAGRRRGLVLLAIAFGLCWPLATLSKENGALLPLLALVIEVFYFRWRGGVRLRRALAALFAVTVGLPVALALAGVLLHPEWVTSGYALRDHGPWERLLTESRVLFDYAANTLLLPGGSPFGIYRDDFPVSRGLLTPPATALALAGWVAFAALAARGVGRAAGPLLGGGMLFVAGHVLESTFLPLELYFEHRNYLPAVGLFLGLGAGLAWVASGRAPRRPLIVLAILLPLAYGAATALRVDQWRSWAGILEAELVGHPDSPRLHTAVASLHMERGRPARAREHLAQARALYGAQHQAALAVHALLVDCFAGERPSAESHAALAAARAGDAGPYLTNTLSLLATRVEAGACAGLDVARVATAVESWLAEDAVAARPAMRWDLLVLLGRILAAGGDPERAVAHLLAADRLRPDAPLPALLATRVLADLGRRDDARRLLDSVTARASAARYRALIAALSERLARGAP